MLTDIEIEKRFPVWEAMSDLFLDTELSEVDHKYIAKQVLESEYSPEEINIILWNEVLPGVGDNLRCVAGEWAGFNPDWLRNRMLSVLNCEDRSLGKGGLISEETLIKITENEWDKVCSYLPPEYKQAISAPKIERMSIKNWWRNFW